MGVERGSWNWGTSWPPFPLRTTEFAPAVFETKEQPSRPCGYGKPAVAAAFKVGRFSGQDFARQPAGTLRCPANQKRIAHTNGARKPMEACAWSMREVTGGVVPGRIPRAVPMEWRGDGKAGARVSVLVHPMVVGSAPLRLRMTGVAGFSGVPASNCFA